jgi:hypothetical protein
MQLNFPPLNWFTATGSTVTRSSKFCCSTGSGSETTDHRYYVNFRTPLRAQSDTNPLPGFVIPNLLPRSAILTPGTSVRVLRYVGFTFSGCQSQTKLMAGSNKVIQKEEGSHDWTIAQSKKGGAGAYDGASTSGMP